MSEVFRAAVAEIDAGNAEAVELLLRANPELVRTRLFEPAPWLRELIGSATDGYFREPYLLWFVAENPVRTGRLAPEIVAVTERILDALRREQPASLREQCDGALGLVASGRVAREAGMQLRLIDLLLDAGARPADVHGALGHGEIAAAEHLVARGVPLTLAAAICLDRDSEVPRLASIVTPDDLQIALAAAALHGKSHSLGLLLDHGADLRAFNSVMHPHATPLHNAVQSGSLETVKLLIGRGAPLSTRDRVFDATPADWAEHMGHAEIAATLRSAEERGAG